MVDPTNKKEHLAEVSFNSSFGAELDSEFISAVDKLEADYCAREGLRSDTAETRASGQHSSLKGIKSDRGSESRPINPLFRQVLEDSEEEEEVETEAEAVEEENAVIDKSHPGSSNTGFTTDWPGGSAKDDLSGSNNGLPPATVASRLPKLRAEPSPEHQTQPSPEIKAKPPPEVRAKPTPDTRPRPHPGIRTKAVPVVSAKPLLDVRIKPHSGVRVNPLPDVKNKPHSGVGVNPHPDGRSMPPPDVISTKPDSAIRTRPHTADLPHEFKTDLTPGVGVDPAPGNDHLLLSSWGLPSEVLLQYRRLSITSMFPWQAECLCTGSVLAGGNLVYSAPTSAGKTMVAELLLLKRVLETKKKAIFILPFVSVAREKMAYLQRLFAGVSVAVDGYMGSVNPVGGFQQLDVAVCTIEKANGLVNRLVRDDNIGQLGMVIVDELHMIGDSHRGYLLELLLTKIYYISEKLHHSSIQIVGLSATLPNLDQLALWLNANVYRTDFRPVPLLEMVKIGLDIYDDRMCKLRRLQPCDTSGDGDNVISLCLETVSGGHSILIFCPTKNRCETLAVAIAKEFCRLGRKRGDMSGRHAVKLDQRKLCDVMEQLRRSPVGLDTVLRTTVHYGVAFHHAGLTFDERDIIEGAFRGGVLRVLVATSTLCSGVNLPARRVIIRTPIFHGQLLDPLMYKQMVGRAGRKGIDTCGESVLVCQESERAKAVRLLTSRPQPVTSCLEQTAEEEPSYQLKRAILEVVVSGLASSRDQLNTYMCSTFMAVSTAEDITHAITANCVAFLLDNEFISVQETTEENGTTVERYRGTQLGRAVLSSALSPDEGLTVFAELRKARQCLVLENDLHIVYLVTPIYGCAWSDLDWYHYLRLWEQLPPDMKRVAELVGVQERFLARAVRGRVPCKTAQQARTVAVHRRFYSALLLQDLICEMSLTDAAAKYKCNRGMLQSLQQSAATFAGMVTVFCRQLGWTNMELLLDQFQSRLTFGIQGDLVDLVRVSLLNAQRARVLFNAGYETVSALATAAPDDIESLLKCAVPFQSMKKGDEETAWEAEERRQSRCIWLNGQRGLTEREAALLVIHEARSLLQEDLHQMGGELAPHRDTDKSESERRDSQEDKSCDDISQSNTVCTTGLAHRQIMPEIGTRHSATVTDSDTGDADGLTQTCVLVPLYGEIIGQGGSEPLDLQSRDAVAGCVVPRTLSSDGGQLQQEELNQHKEKQHKQEQDKEQREQIQKEKLQKEQQLNEKVHKEQIQTEQMQKEKLQKEQMQKEKLQKEQMQKEKLQKEQMQKEQMQNEQVQNEKLQKEQMLKEKLQKEKLQKEQLQKEKLQKEQLQKEKLQKEQLQKEKLQKEQMQREKLQKEQLLKEKLQKEQMQREKLQKEQLQKEKLQKEQMQREKLQKEQMQREKLQKEQMQREKLQKEQLLKEKLHKEQMQREKLQKEQLQKEKLQKEQMQREKLQKEQLQKEKLQKEQMQREKLQKEQLQKEKLQKEQMQREKLQKEQLLKEKLQKEQMQREKLQEEQLQKEQMQREKLQKEQLQKEKLQKEQMQREKLQKEQMQREKLQKEQMLKEKLQKEQMQREKLQKEKLQKEQMQREKLQKEQMQREKLQKEQMQKEMRHKELPQQLVEVKTTCTAGEATTHVTHDSTDHGDMSDAILSSQLLEDLPHVCDVGITDHHDYMGQQSGQIDHTSQILVPAPFSSIREDVDRGSVDLNECLVLAEDIEAAMNMSDSFTCSAMRPNVDQGTGKSEAVEFSLSESLTMSMLEAVEVLNAPLGSTRVGGDTAAQISACPAMQEAVYGDSASHMTRVMVKRVSDDVTVKHIENMVTDEVEEELGSSIPRSSGRKRKQRRHFGMARKRIRRSSTDDSSLSDTTANGSISADVNVSDGVLTPSPPSVQPRRFVGGVVCSPLRSDKVKRRCSDDKRTMVHSQRVRQRARVTRQGRVSKELLMSSSASISKDIVPLGSGQSSPCNDDTPSKVTLKKTTATLDTETGGPGLTQQTLPGSMGSQSFSIIDVAADKELFESFIAEWRSQTHYSLSVACDPVPADPTIGIGNKFNGLEARTTSVDGLLTPGGNTVIVGLAVSWCDRDAYFVALTDNSIHCSLDGSLIAPSLDSAVPLPSRIQAVHTVLQHRSTSAPCTKVIFDLKCHYKLLSQVCGICLEGPFEDPKVANWMLDPDTKESPLHRLVNSFVPSELPLLQCVTSGVGTGSLALGAAGTASGRVRSAIECVLVRQIMQQLHTELQNQQLYSSFVNVEMPSVLVLARMELNGMGFSETECDRQRHLLEARIVSLEQEAYDLAGHDFSLASPADIAQVLYRELRLRDTAVQRLPAKKSSLSTAKDILERMRTQHALPGVILEWRRITNALTKVVFPLRREGVFCRRVGMTRIHPECYTLTATGRVTMHEPSVQNIPRDFEIHMPVVIVESPPADSVTAGVSRYNTRRRGCVTRQSMQRTVSHGTDAKSNMTPDTPLFAVSLRHAFIPFKGGVLLAADYSQLELRMIAHLSRDAKLTDILNSGGDVFKTIAGQLTGLEVNEVTVEMRQQAKQVCYGMIYGIGSKALADQLTVGENEAASFIKSFKTKYKGMSRFLKETVERCRKRGYIETLCGRRRHLPAISSSNMHAKMHAERQAVNSTVQGSAADLVKLAMVNIDQQLTAEFPDTRFCHQHSFLPQETDISARDAGKCRAGNDGAFFILQLHDELMYEVSDQHVTQIAHLVKHHMENAFALTVKMPVKIKVGTSWAQLKDIAL